MRLLLAVGMTVLAFAAPAFAESRLVRTEGTRFIAPDGSVLQIKGISLGNWLMPEGYMFKFEVAKSPRQIYGAFDRLLGPERAAIFWGSYRDRYIREEDIRFIKSVGFNTVRIPIHHALFMNDDGVMAGAGWALLDRVLGWCRAAGLYAIIDLHAAPGGQTGKKLNSFEILREEVEHVIRTHVPAGTGDVDAALGVIGRVIERGMENSVGA